MIAVNEIVLPACVGWEWRRQNDARMQLVWIRNTTGFRFGIQAREDGPWGFVRVTNKRYQPSNLEEARRMAHEFINEGYEGSD